MNEGFQKQLLDKLGAINRAIVSLGQKLEAVEQRARSGLISGSEAMERHWKGVRETRREQREKIELEMLLRDHKEMVKQSKYLLWAVGVAILIGGLGLILEIMKYIRPPLGK